MIQGVSIRFGVENAPLAFAEKHQRGTNGYSGQYARNGTLQTFKANAISGPDFDRFKSDNGAMESSSTWPLAGRVIWLSGGLVAYSEAGESKVELCTGSKGPTVKEFQIPAYGAIYSLLKKLGLEIIGVSFIVNRDELDNLQPAEFRVAGKMTAGWPVSASRESWRQIAWGANKRDDMQLMDIASRIASTLEASELRMLDLVSSYGTQLQALARKHDIRDHAAFTDLFSRGVYNAVHAMFWQLSVLRDTLAEFAGRYCLKQSKRVTKIKSFQNAIRQVGSADPVALMFERASRGELGGWLATFGAYRNFFTHSAPLEMAAGFAFTIQDKRSLGEDLTAPQLYYPLPGDIESLARQRSNGLFYSSMEELVRVSRLHRNRAQDPDALEYLHECTEKLARFSNAFAERSPIPAAPIHLGPEDIIGSVQVKDSR